MSAAARFIWLLTGAVWAARSLVGFADPAYWNPTTTLDWIAVWLFSACWLTLAPAVILLARLVPARPVRAVAVVVAIAALLAGVANGIEDGLGVKSWGTFYVLGSMTAWLGWLALVVTFARARRSRLAWLAGGVVVSFLLFNVGGGFVTLLALGGLAVKPRWFLVADPEPSMVQVARA
ncbi:MAG: hypothetical protein AABZ33_13900 [Chloroflexota bacterium]